MLSGPQCLYFMLYSVSSIALEHHRHLLLENEPKMENWISVLLFLSLPIFNSAGSFLDTSCITHNPTGNTSYDTTFIGVVVYNGRATARSYRRAATTKRFDSYNNYPTLGNTSCTISTVGDRDASRSCGFYSYIHIISQFEREPLINGDEVVLRRSNSKAPVQDNLRFGVFQCIASQQEHRFISTVTIMPEEADFKPPAFTITANLDERVTLEMLASDSSTPTEQVRWRYSWGSVTRELSEWEGNTTPVIEKVKTSDAGVYEAYTTSSTDSGYVRLIVRGCRYNLWGSPSCQWTCPVCYNGGICDDVSGGCVCPPGFTGSQCEQACPSGYIGRRCEISCETVIGVADCRGVEICLPHPFGCSCAAGFSGLDCQTVCDEGAYGAGCTEVCHCPSMSQCNAKTGLCSESGCERSWKGPMCQAKIFDVVGYGRPAAVQIGGSFTVEGLTTLDMDTSVKLLIGRELDTGTGKTGSGMSHEHANLTTMPSTSGLPFGTLQFTSNGEHNCRLTLETMSSNYSHLGVYYVELINGKRRQHTQILRQSNNIGVVQPERFTWSVGTGESVTMTVSYYGYVSSLRWRHNGRDIPSANGNTELTINYARKADEGVYECFPVNRDQSYKGLMLLKVRACPSGFWGIYCNNSCPVCYYQGICHEETGECVCQPGYHGDDCSEVCEDRSNAIGMTCDLNCTTSPELGSKCLYKQVCSPHPVGCHCRAGFGSVPKCNTECQHPYFGADCAMRAHCLITNYNAVSGCNASSCHQHYEGPGCQQLSESQHCPDGHHGKLCNYICHCADSINCNRSTGSCNGGECAEGWGGPNCTDALPALFDAPSVTFVEGGIQVSWNLWRPGYDYGTGLVDSYRVNFGLTNILTEQQERTHEDTNNNYLTYTGLNLVVKYSISLSVIKIIQDEKTVGQSSPSVVVCLSTAPPTNVNAEPTRGEERISFTVSWEDICPSTEFTYDVYFRPATGGSDSVQTVQYERSVTITNGLLQCTEYLVSVRRNAEGSSTDRSAETTVLTDSEVPTAMPTDVRATVLRGVNPVQILVSWTPVNVTKLNLKCDPRTTDYTYEVYYEDAGNGNEHVIRTSSSSTNVTIANGTLSQCTVYLISVGVKNAVGRVNRTSPVTVRTDSEDPTVEIYGVTAQKTGRVDQLQVSWSTNFINQNNLKCMPYTGYTYEVHYHPTDETRAQNISSRGSQRSLTISNLQTCTKYSISVSIINAVGRKSRATYPTVVRSKSDAPSIIPRDVRAQRERMLGTRPQITVTWTVDAITLDNLKCDPTTTEYFFIVYYQETSGGTQRSKLISGTNSMSTTITEQLSQCTNYSISVSVRNAAGIEGNSSSNIYIQTDSEDPTVAIYGVTAQRTDRVDQLQVSWSASRIYRYYLKCYPSTGYTFEVYYNATYETRAQNISTTGSQTSLTISNLQQCTVYSISVSIRNAVGRKSRVTEPITVRTKSEAPSIIPRDIRAQRGPLVGTRPIIAVTWAVDAITSENLKCDPTTTEYSFIVYYQGGGTQRSKEIPGRHSMGTTITERLSQCTNYSISVSVRNAAGIEGNNSSNTYIQTDSEDPSTVFRFTTTRLLGVQPSPQVRVSWPGNRLSTYDLRCDPSLGYTVIISYWPKGEGGVLVKEVDNAVENVNISGLKACTYYKIAMDVRNFIGHESNNQQLAKEVLTDSEDPTTRIEFNVSRINDTNSGQIQVTWTTDAVSFQNLKCDPSLGYDVILRYGESTGNLQKEFVTAEGINRHTLSNLLMCTEYAVSVVIRNIVDRESQNNVKKHVITDSEDVKVTPTNVYTSDVSQTSIELSWQPPESLDYTSMGCHPKYPYKYEISYRSQNFSSVTTILDQSQQEYKFTDLEPGSSYIFYLRLTNYAGRSGPYAVIECNTTVTADVLPFVLGVTFPSVFLIISLLVLVVYLITSPSRSNQCWAIRRGRIQDDNGFIEEEHSEMRTFERDQQIPNVCSSRGKTIHRHELPGYVKEQHLKEGGFHDEYKELIQGKYTSCSVAEAKINERKNRFKNVLTYDHSRVVLPLINGDSSSDYINASYIHGYKKQNAFIACQSPNKASLHDFWRMIWHEKCTKIIMVALPVENGKMKCLTYWLDTDSAPQQYSNISIERTGETASINLMIRHFKLQLGSRIHEVTQYHYFGRPDMKVPQSADILWDIIDEVEKDEDENSPPIVVHCSAGCGWTGTVIALASLRKMMKQEEAIDVFNFVNNMRKQRPLMVQVVEQYQFIFESLLINSYVGKPSTPVDDFHVNLRKWKAVTSLHKQTGLQRQFNMLSFVSPFPEDSENQVGLLSENIVKNRYPVIIPRNKFRPSLVTFVEDKTATDYINASFCDGYSKKDLFISTQLPLPNTIVDFWRMVIDYEVATIVTFEAHQTWLRYLPSEGAYQYGPFSVRVMELTQEDDITTRVLRISMDHSTYQNKKGLRMWITNISLSSPSLSSFVSLLEKTQAVQRQNENRRIVVQCLDGVSQCGMFMAVYNCCTGIIVDKVIDLFTMVRKLRERRPEMVGTLEQYEFCTQAISRKLSTSHVYANE